MELKKHIFFYRCRVFFHTSIHNYIKKYPRSMLVKVKVHSCSSLKWGKVSSFAFSGINMELKNRRSHFGLFYR